MPPENQAVVKKEDKPMEYVPFGSKETIKLSIAIVRDLIAVKTKSGKTCSEQDAIKFLLMCKSRLLDPFTGDAFLIGYDGRDGASFSLITAHQAFLKRAEMNQEYDGMKSGIIVEQDGQLKDLEGDFYSEGQVVKGGWASVFFKNRSHPMHKRIRLERFQKSWGIWQDDPAGMICKCAEADALRSSFPTMLGGLYIKEETSTVKEDSKTTSPIFTTPPADEVPDAEVIQEEPPVAQPAKPAAKPKQEVRPAQMGAGLSPDSPVKKMREDIATAGLTVEKVLACLVELGCIEPEIATMEQLYLEAKPTFEMLDKQKGDIFDRCKTN